MGCTTQLPALLEKNPLSSILTVPTVRSPHYNSAITNKPRKYNHMLLTKPCDAARDPVPLPIPGVSGRRSHPAAVLDLVYQTHLSKRLKRRSR